MRSPPPFGRIVIHQPRASIGDASVDYRSTVSVVSIQMFNELR